MREIKRIALATDFSKASSVAEELAVTLSKKLGAELHVIHVFDPSTFDMPAPYYFMPGADTWLGDRLVELKTRGETHLKEHAEVLGPCVAKLLEGHPGKEIVAYVEANEIDMAVMGSHGHTGLERWVMGSVTEYVMRHTKVPILTTRE